jgi:type IV secretion system protein VirB3
VAEELPDEEFESPIHRSLNRPILVMGGERQLVLLLMLLAGIFIVSLAKLWAAIIGVIVWVVGQYGLSQAAKFDPQLSLTGRRLLQYKRFYPASATPFADPPKWKD